MGEYQDKVFTVGIKHGKRQLAIVIFTEIWITAHVVGEIVHPAHIPLIIKTNSAVFWITGDHWPCSRLLCDQHRTVLSALEYSI